jgi:hypothetical protein
MSGREEPSLTLSYKKLRSNSLSADLENEQKYDLFY